MELITTPIEFSIHTKGNDPIYGENVVHVRIQDEGAGQFIVIRDVNPSESEYADKGQLALDFEHIEAIHELIKSMTEGVEDV